MNRMRIALYGSMALMAAGLIFAATSAPALGDAGEAIPSSRGDCPAMKQCPALQESGSQPTRRDSGRTSPSTDARLMA